MSKLSTERAIEALDTVRAYYASLTGGYPKGNDCKAIDDITCSEIANSCLMAIKALEQEHCEDLKDALYIAQTDRDKWVARAKKLAKIIGIRDCDIDEYEQEPCKDCISREKAKQFLYERLDRLNDNELYDIFSRIIDDMYNELPSITPIQRWISVSERLPEVGSTVLVCFDFKGKRSVYISDYYGDGEFHGFDDEYLTSEGRKYRKAVAWMPLPEPYKAESEGKGINERFTQN